MKFRSLGSTRGRIRSNKAVLTRQFAAVRRGRPFAAGASNARRNSHGRSDSDRLAHAPVCHTRPMMSRAASHAAALALALCAMTASAAPVRTEHVTAELVAEHAAVRPGEALQIGLKLQHIAHWHTYWRNPGDSGMPTTLQWTLPAGSNASPIDWPAPQRLPFGPLVNYGYKGELLLALRYTPPADARAGETLQLRARADWLVCSDICIPEHAELTLTLPVVAAGAPTPPGAERALFERHATLRPVALEGWTASVQQAGRELLLELAPDDGAAAPAARPALHFFPYAEQVLEPARHELLRTPSGYALKLALADGAQLPARLDGVLVALGGPSAVPPWAGARRAVEVSAPVRSVAALTLPAQAEPMATTVTAPAQIGTSGTRLWAALALALAGGALLNLMPCVFPVLSIKLLSLAQQRDDRAALRRHALAYGAGVLLSFLVLAAALLALRAAGTSIGWGFQLQEPGVVFVLTLLFFALGLNLMGAFEFATLLPQRLAGWRARRPAADALASGALAVVAASPCTAPFMGAALGYAVTQSVGEALGVFAALGIGMALPYMLLALMPGWRSRLPRPGPWMLHLKQLLAFPMFATVVWLLWVLGQQAGVDGAAKALLACVGMAFLIWLAGLARMAPARALAGRAFAALALVALLAWSWPGTPTPAQAAAGATSHPVAAAWQPYDEAQIARHMAAGRPVFVDFTAAWCVSCQVNKRLVLNTDATTQAFERHNVVLMRADWTQRDARITEALARLGRNGVPVYLLIRPGREPLLLPEILTGRIVTDALATL